MKLGKLFDDITCKSCRAKLEQAPRNEHNYPLASEIFEVGNMANHSMGHAMYFTKTGRVALCIVQKKEK